MEKKFLKLPDGRLIQMAPGASATPNLNARSLTPNLLNRSGVEGTPMSIGRTTVNRSHTSFGSEIPGEKQFIEVNTNEQLIISTIGIYGSRQGEDRFVPLESAE